MFALKVGDKIGLLFLAGELARDEDLEDPLDDECESKDEEDEILILGWDLMDLKDIEGVLLLLLLLL